MPQPKSDKELKASGGYRKDRHGNRMTAPEAKRLDPPAWIDATAKREWKRVVKILQKSASLGDLDQAVLATYCQAYSETQQLSKDIRAEGYVLETIKGTFIGNPKVTALNQARTCLGQCIKSLGLSPLDRTRVKVSNVATDEQAKAASKEERDEAEFFKNVTKFG